MISKKAKYGLKALKVLAEEYSQDNYVLISFIAEKEHIPRKFLEAILLDLRNNGILHSQKGRGGGYMLRMAPDEISFARVIRAVDGPIAPVRCVSLNFYGKCRDCPEEETCALRAVMTEWRDANLSVLENKTVANLLATPVSE